MGGPSPQVKQTQAIALGLLLWPRSLGPSVTSEFALSLPSLQTHLTHDGFGFIRF